MRSRIVGIANGHAHDAVHAAADEVPVAGVEVLTARPTGVLPGELLRIAQ